MVGGVFGLSNPLVSFRNFMEDPQAQMDDFADDPQIQAKIDYFKENIAKVETIDELFADRRLAEFVLSAFSLEGEVNNGIGRIKAVLEANYNDPTSLPNILADPKFRDMAGELRLDRDGLAAFENSDLIDSLTQRFIRNEFEVKLGQEDAALREALFFSRSITNAETVYDILGDSVLRSVVQGALEIPDELAIQPVDTQARAISSRIDVEKLISLSNGLDTSQSQIERARTDASILEKNLTASDKAISQTTGLSEQLDLILNAYSDLANVTDPVSGPYAADIPFQETGVPDLIRFEQMLDAGDEGVETIEFLLDQLEGLITAANEPGADLPALQTSFSSIIVSINDAIDVDAQTLNPSGGTDNILGNGANSNLFAQLTDDGITARISLFDMNAFQTSLASAETSFYAITGPGDSDANASLGRILISRDFLDGVKETLATDRIELNETIASVEAFAATLNTNELIQGKESVVDALDRVTTIENLLDQIQDLAEESAERLPSADRSDLDAQFTDLKTQLRDAITNTNGIGFDNFLDNIPNQTYEIINGATITVSGNIDLATTIADVLDTEDITTQAGATSLANQAVLLEIRTDQARNSLEKDLTPLNSVLNKYDPRGAIDNALYIIEDQISQFIADAESEGVNLLSAGQNDITLDVSSSFSGITLSAFNSFESDLTAGLASAISFLQTDLTQARTEILNLKDIVDSVKRGLSSDANRANVELAKNSAVIDAADAQAESLEDNPYQVNNFTLKFIERFLILNGGQGGTQSTSQDSYLTGLFQPLDTSGTGGQGGDPFSSIFNLLT